MIRLVTLDAIDPTDLASLRQALWTAFGLGTEHAGDKAMPTGVAAAHGRLDAVALLAAAPLSLAAGPLGAPPCWGFAEYGGARAVVSLSGLPARGASEASIEVYRRRLAREVIHVIGHLWDLHHCYDPRCAMHPSWSPGLAAAPESDLCTFCREKSERRIRLAKS